MEEEIKKMLYEKIKHSEQGLTNGEVLLAIYLLAQEKENKETKEEIKIGKKITVKGSGGFGTEILLDDKYSIDWLSEFKIEMDPIDGAKVILEFSPHEIEIKTNKEEAIF